MRSIQGTEHPLFQENRGWGICFPTPDISLRGPEGPWNRLAYPWLRFGPARPAVDRTGRSTVPQDANRSRQAFQAQFLRPADAFDLAVSGVLCQG